MCHGHWRQGGDIFAKHETQLKAGVAAVENSCTVGVLSVFNHPKEGGSKEGSTHVEFIFGVLL